MNAPTPRRRRTRGLTLIELMIGLGISAVLMSLAVPSFATYLQRGRLKAASQGLEIDLREARYEAARRGTPRYLSVKPGAGASWCYAISTTPDCDCQQTSACRIKAQRGSDMRGVQLQESHTVRFDPATGNPDAPGTAAVWSAPGGERVQVSVNAMGRPWVCTLDGALPPFPAC